MANKEYFISNGLLRLFIYEILDDGTYGDPYDLGELIEFSMTVNENSASMYAGNRQILVDTALGELPITFTLPGLNQEDQCKIYGHKMVNGRMVKTSNDVKPYFGAQLAITVKSDKNGKEYKEVLELPKVQFGLGSTSAKTKEGTPQLNSLQISGNAMPLANGIYQMIGSTANEDYVDTYGIEFTVPEGIGEEAKLTIYAGGMSVADRDNSSLVIDAAYLTANFDKYEGESPISCQTASAKVDGKLCAFVTPKAIRRLLDGTDLDVISTFVEKDITVDGVAMKLYVEEGSVTNGAYDIPFKLVF